MLEKIMMSKMFPALFSKYELLSHEGKVINYKYLSMTIEAMLVYYIIEKYSALNIKPLKDSNRKSLKSNVDDHFNLYNNHREINRTCPRSQSRLATPSKDKHPGLLTEHQGLFSLPYVLSDTKIKVRYFNKNSCQHKLIF